MSLPKVWKHEQLKFLHSIGCETIQGLFQQAAYMAELESFILAHRPLPGLGTKRPALN
jgi:hypothetical protein